MEFELLHIQLLFPQIMDLREEMFQFSINLLRGMEL